MRHLLLFLLVSGSAFAAITPEPPKSDYVSDVLDDRATLISQGWGELGIDTAVKPTDGRAASPLRIKDTTYTKGLGHHAPGEIELALDGDYSAFAAEIGIQWQGENTAGSVVFQIYVDGMLRFDSGVMHQQDGPRKVGVYTQGAQTVRLVVTDGGDGITCDCADWANARLVRMIPFKSHPPQDEVDMGAFARVITCDPHRMDGAHSTRVQEFDPGDVYLEKPVPQKDGIYVVPRESDGLGCIGLQWAETRFLRGLALEFAPDNPVPPVAGVQVQYWTGESPWQGNWKTLQGAIKQDKNRWTVPISRKENADFPRAGVDKIRWLFPAVQQPIAVKKLSGFTRARLETASLRIELEKPRPGERAFIDLYNGTFIEGPNPSDAEVYTWDMAGPARFTMRYTKLRTGKTDRSIIRIHLPEGGCGVAVEDAIKAGGVYVRDLGLYVTTATAPQSLAEYRDSIATRKTILERVREMPDQTLAQAMEKTHNPVQDLGPMLLSLACDNRKVIANRDGAIQFAPYGDEPVDKKGTFAPSHRLATRFGSGKSEDVKRSLRGAWLPAPEIVVNDGGVAYTQCTFVAPAGEPLATAPLWLNSKPLCVVEYRVENPGDAPADASLLLSLAEGDKKCLADKVEEGAIFARAGDLIALADARAGAPLACTVNADGITISGKLAPHAAAHCYVYIPLWKIAAETFQPTTAPERNFENLTRYWNEALAASMQIEIPEPFLADVIRASQVHCLLAARNDQDGRNVAAWIGSDRYGPLESEAHSLILGMDLVGQEEFARRSLDYFVKRYSPQGYLTTGYTLMGTGWHLWTLARHYELTADTKWLEVIAPQVSAACQWIAAQLEKTRQMKDPEAYPEIGLMPPGVGADWNRFAYRFAIQAHFCAGLRDAARTLAAIKFPTANREIEAAAQYQKDLLRAYKWNQVRTPAWQLSTGAYVPAYSGMLYGFGETGEIIPGEDGNRSWAYDVELGAHHLIPLGIIDANSADADEIINHMEDHWFLHAGMGDYPAEKNEEDWFNLGGFSKVQPYYTRNAEICAARDDVKPFIRSYFNAMASLISRENLSFWEHFHNTGAWNKTHETGWFLVQTRTMYVNERGDELWLAPFVPSAWLEDGKAVSVKKAPTKFGPVNFGIKSSIAKGVIEATVDPPTRTQPAAIVIRLRHPQGAQMKSVTVNGKPHKDFDPAKECVRIKSVTGRLAIRAEY